MNKDTDYFKQGQKDCRSFYTGQAFSAFTSNMQAEDALKLFWPPEKEMLTQISTPRPKPKQKWLQGFKKEQVTIIAENIVKCVNCGTDLIDNKE